MGVRADLRLWAPPFQARGGEREAHKVILPWGRAVFWPGGPNVQPGTNGKWADGPSDALCVGLKVRGWSVPGGVGDPGMGVGVGTKMASWGRSLWKLAGQLKGVCQRWEEAGRRKLGPGDHRAAAWLGVGKAELAAAPQLGEGGGAILSGRRLGRWA